MEGRRGQGTEGENNSTIVNSTPAVKVTFRKSMLTKIIVAMCRKRDILRSSQLKREKMPS